MKLSVGFSPCPNDTFIFDAIVNKKIDTKGFDFEFHIEDVETLNKRAFNQELDITKLSFHTYLYLISKYSLLNSGSALGNNCGPILISKTYFPLSEINHQTIGIPGRYTTANLLLSLAFPNVVNKTEMLFSDIEDAIIKGKTDAGVIIHENRFTYEKRGLKKIIDLGEWWETETGLPLPLGGIVIKKTFSTEVAANINDIIKRSVEFALDNPASSEKFIEQYAREMDKRVRWEHIKLYVNQYTVDLGKTGREAVDALLKKAKDILPV